MAKTEEFLKRNSVNKFHYGEQGYIPCTSYDIDENNIEDLIRCIKHDLMYETDGITNKS